MPQDWAARPPILIPHGINICSWGPQSLGGMSNNAPASAAWPSANLAIYVPFRISGPITATKLWLVNGATASGNLDMGIYAADGTRLVSIGSTAQAGTSAIQSLDITDTELGPGLYYLALAMNGTTGTFEGIGLAAGSLIAAGAQMAGVAQQASAFALPATATFASYAQARVPCCALTTAGVL